MKQKELNLLYSYILNNRIRLKNDVRQLQSNLRYRNIDVIDCLELAVAIERYNTFKETTNHIKFLLNIKNVENISNKGEFDLKNREKDDII